MLTKEEKTLHNPWQTARITPGKEPNARKRTWHASALMQSGVKSKPSSTFESGAISETCAKSAADKGSVAMLAESVRETLSLTNAFAFDEKVLCFVLPNALVKNGTNTMIPSVESADSANEAETDIAGSTKRQVKIQSAKAFCEAARLRAKNDMHAKRDIKAARNAERGNAHTKRNSTTSSTDNSA